MGSREDFIRQFEIPEYPSMVLRMAGEDWISLKGRGEELHFAKGQTIAEAGEEVRYCYQVLSGTAMSMELTESGNMHIFNIFDEGSIFLESNILIGEPAAVTFMAQTVLTAVAINREGLLSLIENEPMSALYLIRSLAYKYWAAMDRVREGYSRDALWRVYNMFALLTADFGEEADAGWVRVKLKASQQLIADMLGMNRATVSSAIGQLRQRGLISLVNGYYCIRRADGVV